MCVYTLGGTWLSGPSWVPVAILLIVLLRPMPPRNHVVRPKEAFTRPKRPVSASCTNTSMIPYIQYLYYVLVEDRFWERSVERSLGIYR